MATGPKYPFEGQEVTPAELAKRCTCYSAPWLAEALKAGCRSVRDLSMRYAEARKRERLGGDKGKRKTARLHSLNFRHLKNQI